MSNSASKPTLHTVDNGVWRQIIDAVPDIAYVISPTGEFLDVNTALCNALRLPRELLIGTRLAAYLQRDSLPIYERILSELAERRRPERSSRSFAAENAEPLLFEIIEIPLVREGSVWAIAGVGRDVTQEAVLERRLWDDTETRQTAVDFALRTSLGLIKGYVFTLGRSGIVTEERRARFTQVIEEEIDHLAKIIEDLLDIRRLDAGEYDVPGEVVGVVEAAQIAVEQCRDEAQRRQIRVELVLPEKIDPVYVPLEALVRVLHNLVQNAVHHTLHNGNVWVTVHDAHDYVEVAVRDSGVGIPAEDLPYIFDRFYRGRSSAAAPVQGIGIGLAVTRMLVDAMGGRITVQSKVGAGSEFQVVLPRRTFHIDCRNDAPCTDSAPAARSAYMTEGNPNG